MLAKISTETKIIVGVIIVTVVLLFGGIFLLSKGSATTGTSSTAAETVNFDQSRGQKIGSDSAKVKLVEFGDFQCPACAAAEPTVAAIRAAKYDNFQLIFRNFPLTQHLNAIPAANLAQFAAANGKYWEVHDKLYETQSEWSEQKDPTDFLVGIATGFGLDGNAAREAIKNQQFKDLIQTDLNDGSNAGVDSTPTFYINGKKVSLTNYPDLKQLVEEELKK